MATLDFAGYDPITGISVVVLKRKGELFFGETQLHEEDIDVASEYAGCAFAEVKAIIAMLKFDLKEARAKLKVMKEMYQGITQLRQFPIEKHTQTNQHLRKAIKIQETKIETLKDRIAGLEDGFVDMVDARLNGAREIQKKVSSNEEE